MSIHDEQTAPPWGRIVLFVVAALLALILPFVLVSRVLNTRAADNAGTVPPSSAPAASHSPLVTTSGKSVASAAATTKTTSTSQATGQGGALDDATESCRLANLRQQTDLAAAAVALEQFQKHIDAMNLLVAGKISLSVATTYWAQSRVDAGAKSAAFRAADADLAASKAGCPELGPTAACSAPIEQVNAITACAKAATARVVVLTRARAAITTWEHHIGDMEMFRMGHMSPSAMGAKWLKTWKAGQSQVDTYSAALLAANLLKCPLT
jgi:hypothetical protein